MSTCIHVSGLSYFCTDDKLRQAFSPFGTVVLAQVLRDELGHALGLGVIHMACSEDVERVFNEHQRFEISGSRVDLWEPAELEEPQAGRMAAYGLQDTRAEEKRQSTGLEKSQNAFQSMAVFGHRVAQTLLPTFWTVKGLPSYNRGSNLPPWIKY
jgi:RNA recognition motif-containing protein